MTGNTVIVDRGNGPVVSFFASPSVSISQNTFVGRDAISNLGDTSNNTNFASRGSAALSDFPSLAAPGGTPTPLSSGSTWTDCAPENGYCPFSGTATVRYGANGSYANGTFTDGVSCSNSIFGDPLPGTVKRCSVSSSSGSAGAAVVSIQNTHSGRCIDVPSGSNTPGTQLQQYDCDSANVNQLFSVSKNGDGSYTFKNSGVVNV